MTDPSARWETLCADLAAAPAGDGYHYPDDDNAMEAQVISARGRSEERAAWTAFLDATPPGDGHAWDAGCGRGAYTADLAARFPHVLATDADARRVAHARSLGPPHARFFALPLLAPAFSSENARGLFSLVQCIQVLGHVPIDHVAPILAVLRGAVATDGTLLLAVPYTNEERDLWWVTGRAAGVIAGGQVTPHAYDALARVPRAGELPVRHFALPTLHRLASQAGLSVEEVRPYNWLHATRADVLLRLKVRAG